MMLAVAWAVSPSRLILTLEEASNFSPLVRWLRMAPRQRNKHEPRNNKTIAVVTRRDIVAN